MTGQARVRRLDSAEVEVFRPQFIGLYREVYAEPPYHEGEEHVAAYVDRFVEESARPGFTLVIAEIKSELVGYAYGHSLHPDEWWPDADYEPDQVKGRSKFTVIELAIRKPHRGQGIGTALMKALLTGRPEELATLCSNPAAPARRIYQYWGWQPVARAHPAGIPPMDILILPIRTEQAKDWTL